MPQYGNTNDQGDWKPEKLMPKLTWTAANEQEFLANKARQEEQADVRTIGQVAQAWARTVGLDNDIMPCEALLAWAFKK